MSGNFAEDFSRRRILAVLRGVTPDSIIETCEALYEGGIRFVEVTMNSPDPLISIKLAARNFAGADLHVGAGTVLAPEEAADVARAGGTYVVSPNTDTAVIRRTKELGLISIPGFMTPTEGFMAAAAGADFLKCFPVNVLGPGYLKSLKAVLNAPVLAVGGVNLENIASYLKVAAGVALGANLFSPGKPVAELRRDASLYSAAVEAAEDKER